MSDEESAKPIDAASEAPPPPSSAASGVQPYELAPEPPRPSPPASAAPKGRIDKGRFIDDFDDDADFTHDPEVDAARTGKAAKRPAESADAPPAAQPALNEIVVPGRGMAKVVAIVGGVLAVAAAIAAAIEAPPGSSRFFVSVNTLFSVALHTVTGVGALGIAAALLGKLLRHTELAAARMLVATALFALGWHLNLNASAHILGAVIGTGAYFLAVWFLFRLNPKHAFIVAACHFALWTLFFLSHSLSSLAEPAPASRPAVVAPAAGS